MSICHFAHLFLDSQHDQFGSQIYLLLINLVHKITNTYIRNVYNTFKN
jgi:hypothetical protein